MISFLQKQWFLIGICSCALLGYIFPDWGRLIEQYDVISIGIFLSFFCTGLCLESRSVLRLVTTLRAPIAAVFSSLALYPVIAWLLALQLLPTEFVIGICLIGAAPVTLSSGTIMTAIARGNVPLSILICIITNLLAIFTMPLMLTLLLHVAGSVDLPVKQMIYGLFIVVLAPLLAGQCARPFCMNIVSRYENPLSIFQSCIIILIIFNVVSNSADQINRAGGELFGVFFFVFFLYFLMLLVNYLIAGLLKLDTSSMIAFTIHTSQKTLAVSYVVWSAHFAADYPVAFLPAIMCQLVQMIAGTFVARFFRQRYQP